MRKPHEVSIALWMLWLSLGVGTIDVLVAALNGLGIMPPSGDFPAAWSVSEFVGLLGLVFQVICIASVTRGHGLVRLPLLIGIGWIASRIGFGGISWMAQSLAPYRRIAPLGLALHTVAVGLLFLPRSNFWFRDIQKRRHEDTQSTTSDFERV